MQLKQATQFHNADDDKKQQIKGCRAMPNVGDEVATMAVHPGTQERFFVFSNYAVPFCSIADGPKRH